MVGADKKKIVDRLPYIGLDIESSDANTVRVEYSPNRPDLGTDYGIAMALRGLMGKEVGMPSFICPPSGITVSVDPRLFSIRPHIACLTATGLKMDDEDVRQLISLQEDLHNGLGRRRKRVAIGLHDLEAVSPPVEYVARSADFRFKPLDGKKELSLREIISGTEQGREYGGIFGRARLFPVISDSKGVVLSFPPVINGSTTKVSALTRRLFVDVTSMDMRAGDDVLGVLATTLAAMGAQVSSVKVKYARGSRTTPDLKPSSVSLDMKLIESVLGMGLPRKQVVQCLERSRLGVRGRRVMVPRYRFDILHPIDMAEEVALGFGFDKIPSLYPESRQPGSFNALDQFLERSADVMASSGMVELMNYELVDEQTLYSNFGRTGENRIGVENARSMEHSVLRDSLLPSLMAFLGRNVKEEYPQKVFELGRVYLRRGRAVSEEWRLGCLLAHSQSSYTEAKMHLESFLWLMAGKEATTRPSNHWAFSPGRSASVSLGRLTLGQVGEVRPEAINSFQLGVPVSGFEVNVSSIFERLK